MKSLDLGGGGCCSGDLVTVDLFDQIRFVLLDIFSGFRCNYCVWVSSL